MIGREPILALLAWPTPVMVAAQSGVATGSGAAAEAVPWVGWLSSFSIGLGVGLLVAGGVAFYLARRQVRQLRLADRRAQRAERMAELGAMAAGLAHEIKNPLSTIGLNAQLLSEGLGELSVPEDQRGRLVRRMQSLTREVDRLRSILSDFLEFAGQISIDPKTQDVNQLVEELVDFFVPQAQRAGVLLRADTLETPALAAVDGRHLKQAILNLMLNALQAMSPSGGTVEQGSADARRLELLVRVRPARMADGTDAVEIHVIDTGPGIDGATVARIFEPYFTTKAGGTGLGLPTSRRLIELHGGTLTVQSQRGTGSDFIVTIPVREPAHKPENRERPRARSGDAASAAHGSR